MHVKKFTFNPFQENTYVLHAAGEGIIVDPGCSDEDEQRELETWLDKNEVRPTRLLLTHAHVDHVLGCAWLKRRYDLLPEVHRKDLFILQNAQVSGAMFGVNCEPVPAPKRFIEEGEIVKLGDEHLDVLFVPGHAPGMWPSTTRSSASCSAATYSSTAASAARTCPAAIWIRC
jgi:hydroxyacylglutathione hydrolase